VKREKEPLPEVQIHLFPNSFYISRSLILDISSLFTTHIRFSLVLVLLLFHCVQEEDQLLNFVAVGDIHPNALGKKITQPPQIILPH
jgi:hypothetical protein